MNMSEIKDTKNINFGDEKRFRDRVELAVHHGAEVCFVPELLGGVLLQQCLCSVSTPATAVRPLYLSDWALSTEV